MAEKIYIAGPFFTPKERMYLNEMISYVKKKSPSAELFIPMEHFVPNGANLPNDEWASKVFDIDVDSLEMCDTVYALYLGHYSDTGTAWEIGYASAKGKRVNLYVPRAFSNTDMSIMPLNSSVSICDEIDENINKSIYNQK